MQSETSGFNIADFDSGGPYCTRYNAQSNGTSVCDDVILIPVNSGTEVQFVQISVYNNFLTLCEVQVFAGNVIKIISLVQQCQPLKFKNLAVHVSPTISSKNCLNEKVGFNMHV